MTTINDLRKKIKKVDRQIIKKLAERQQLSKQIGLIKQNIGEKITDPEREKSLMAYYEGLCNDFSLEFSLVKRLFKAIILYSRKLQAPLQQ